MRRRVPGGRIARARTSAVAAFSVVLLAAALVPPAPSSADDDHADLHHRKNRLSRQIDRKQLDLDEISTRLVRAQRRVDTAVDDLADARTRLQAIREDVAAAAALDRLMQDRLDQAIVRLRDARDDLTAGREDVRSEHAALAAYAIADYQSGGVGMLNLGVAFDAQNAQDVLDNMQAADTMLAKQSVGVQQLQAKEVLLELTEQRVQDTKEEVADRRAEAAENLQRKRALEREARAARRQVVDRLQTLRDLKQQIADAKRAEIARLDRMEKERDRVEERLRRIAERRARRHDQRLSDHAAHSGGFLNYPVANTYITSPYGMRFHPILHVWKLHDGTDFHATCGTPVYAAAAGTISSEYYNGGYGNRIIVDHGFVKGVSLWTSYNHLTSFVAKTGDHVDRGELIAYSGTTGYSTGCHLHFMVYVNGYTVNPMGWL